MIRNCKWLIILVCFFAPLSEAFAQKVEFETLEINYGDIAKGANGVRFFRKAQIGIVSSVVLSKETKEPVKVIITLTGTDQKGKKYAVSTDVASLYKTEKIQRYLTIEASEDNNIFITDATISATDGSNKTTTATESFDVAKTETSFAILLNGIAKPRNGKGSCNYGKCFCFSAKDNSGAEFLHLGNLNVEQTLQLDKENKNNLFGAKFTLKNFDQEEFAMLQSLIIWGEIEVVAIISDELHNGGTVGFRVVPTGKGGNNEIMANSENYKMGSDAKSNRITSIQLVITDVKENATKLKSTYHSGYTKPTSNFHVWNETWLIDQGVNYCTGIKQKEVFYNQTESSKAVYLELGLNDLVKSTDQNAIEKMLTSRRVHTYAAVTWEGGNGKTYNHTMTGIETGSGHWLLYDTFMKADSKENPLLKAVDVYFVNVCGDTFVFEATHKIDLKSGGRFGGKLGGIMGTVKGGVKGNPGGGLNALLITPGPGISISGGSILISDNSKFSVEGSLINVNNGNFKRKAASSTAVLRGRWDDNYSDGKSPGTWSSSREMFEYTFSFNASKEKPITLTDYTLYLVNEKKDTIVYDGTGEIATSLDGKTFIALLDKGEKIKYFNPCNTKYKLKEITYAESSNSGIYGLKVSFQFENNGDVPDSVAMIVEVKDCNGNSSYIQIALKYDSNKQTYTGSQALSEVKGCKYEMVYGEIAAYNLCGEKTVWSFETSKSKSNGSGTRNVATANNGKPGLL
ncbi:MAG: hypothetical protein JNL57_06510 [Bacteroidetes bacterium]|nr:hypothetical protein [Bacteroidota bacterium]